MNKAAKKRWIEALRSKKYIQGFGALLSNNGTFCPLGVLCDIEIDGDWEEVDRFRVYSLNGNFTELDGWWAIGGERLFPPYSLRKRMRLSYSDLHRVTFMNDANSYSFDRIAAFIEKEL